MSADVSVENFKAINDSEGQFYQADDDVLEFNSRFLNSESQVMFAQFDVEITTQEIIKGIRELKLGRSGGPDRLINDFFIYVCFSYFSVWRFTGKYILW